MYLLILTSITLIIVSYAIVVKPLIPMIRLKMQFGISARLDYYPLIGIFRDLKQSIRKYNDAFEHYRRKMNDCGQLVKFRISNIGDTPLIFIADPEYYQYVYQDHQNYAKYDYIGMDKLLKEGLLYSNGEKWKNQKKILGEAFTYEKLRSRVPMMNDVVEQLISNIDMKELTNSMTQITSEVMIRSFFGKEGQKFIINGKPAAVSINLLLDDMAYESMGLFHMFKQTLIGSKSWSIFPTKSEFSINRQITDLKFQLEKMIQQAIVLKQLPPSETGFVEDKEDNLLNVYLDAYINQKQTGFKITIEDIIQQFITIFFTGSDTTACTAAACLYYLSQYQQAQEDLYQEILSVIGSGRLEDYHLPKLVKLQAFINEVLRLKNPAVQPLLRKAIKSHKIKDLQIQQGWYVQVENYQPCSSNQYISNPGEFDYTRWLDKKNPVLNDNGYVFIPFSSGQRQCLGTHMALMELKVILSKILQKFILKPTVQQPIWMVKFLYTFHPQNVVKFIPRE